MTREEIENEVRSDLARMDLDFLHRETGISYQTKVTLITGYLLFLLEKYAEIRPLDEVAITLNRVKDLEKQLAELKEHHREVSEWYEEEFDKREVLEKKLALAVEALDHYGIFDVARQALADYKKED